MFIVLWVAVKLHTKKPNTNQNMFIARVDWVINDMLYMELCAEME